ncbi:HNH endonuclease signature motif containing protein [Microbacterium atlanticum]|uniref:HNH endonuclease signature motif containing protein n=1 Tax=Microbacterium atlanticum TaxID=2782168 RepID=UPI00188916FD|nr:HNH endonuclease signature motif containing protein [Microbacterium atlanticum]
MTNLAAALMALGDALAERVAAGFGDDGLRLADDDELLATLAAAGRLRRGAEALLAEAVAQLIERDEERAQPDRLTARNGCRNAGELIQRATRVSSRTAAEVLAAAKAVRRPTSLSTGEALPAEFPHLRLALAAGAVGIDGMATVVSAFRGCGAGRAELLAADEELAAAACGEGADAAPPATADDLRAFALVWAAYLDQDGAEPAESRAMRKRGLTIGRRGEDGLVPVRGGLLPEVAAQLQLGFDSVLNPKVDDVQGPCFSESEPSDCDDSVGGAADRRTPAQKRHDVLAVLLTAAVASGELPMLGGAAPTLVVSVREQDLASGRGYAHLPGDDEPVSIAAARHIACAGAVQRVVLGAAGRIVSMRTLDRVFNHHQRRAITLRDGGCLIPGCQVPPQWCEVHHVEEHSRGGSTHTDNGVLLCWFHHRTIDSGGWQVAMVEGVPYVRGPAWWDAQRTWRPVTRSPIRRRERMAVRQT